MKDIKEMFLASLFVTGASFLWLQSGVLGGLAASCLFFGIIGLGFSLVQLLHRGMKD